MAQQFQNSIKDPRLSDVSWKEHEGKFGPYGSVFSKDYQWLADLVRQNANVKGYLYDQEGLYKYKLSVNGDFINRYNKNRAELGLPPVEPNIIMQRKQDRVGLEAGTSYSDGAKKGHEENVAMHQEYMDAHKDQMQMLRVVDEGNRLLHGAIVELTRTLQKREGGGLE